MPSAVIPPQEIHGTIDSVSMQHLSKAPAVSIKSNNKKSPIFGLTVIENVIKMKRLFIYLDKDGGLTDEWKKTCGNDVIQQLIIKWGDLSGLRLCQISGGMKPRSLGQLLKKHEFNDTCDKVIVKIGLKAVSHHGVPKFIIVTNDSDFWHPLDSSRKGDTSAPVASALASNNLHSTLLIDFFREIA